MKKRNQSKIVLLLTASVSRMIKAILPVPDWVAELDNLCTHFSNMRLKQRLSQEFEKKHPSRGYPVIPDTELGLTEKGVLCDQTIHTLLDKGLALYRPESKGGYIPTTHGITTWSEYSFRIKLYKRLGIKIC